MEQNKEKIIGEGLNLLKSEVGKTLVSLVERPWGGIKDGSEFARENKLPIPSGKSIKNNHYTERVYVSAMCFAPTGVPFDRSGFQDVNRTEQKMRVKFNYKGVSFYDIFTLWVH